MMSSPTSRHVVRRTYGKAPPRTSSASSLFDPSSPPPPSSSACRLSSPESSYRLQSPLDDSPPPKIRPRTSSPLFFSAEDGDDELERDAPLVEPLEAMEHKQVKGKAAAKVVFNKKAKQSSLSGFFAPVPKKRPLHPATTVPAPKRSSDPEVLRGSLKAAVTLRPSASSCSSTPTAKPKSGRQALTQMHLTHLPLMHTCAECEMSFMRGGQDEKVHAVHHTRVLRGIVWENVKKGEGEAWKVVKEDVDFGDGKGKGRGRIVVVDGSYGGNKLVEILGTVDRVLSAPPLPPAILERCKIFLFLTDSLPPPPRNPAKRLKLDPTANKGGNKERVVSVVVAQGIKWAMQVLKDGEDVPGKGRVVETGGFGSVTCDPTPLPTPLGIHRLYTTPSYRSHSLSLHLLNASLEHTVYGCQFDPKSGEVAFSQPTESGRSVMEKWGEGAVRVFVDDETQL